MILKPLLILSIICNLSGFNLSALNTDQKIANYYSRENSSSAVAAEKNISLPEIANLPSAKLNSSKVNILTKNYVLIDGDSGVTLLEKKSDVRVPIASTTKIMTAVVALENYQLEDVATVPTKATIQTPTLVFLRTGEKITISELLHCLLIKSGNDSAYTIAAAMDKSVAGDDIFPFVEKMNQKAQELGMANTHYLDPAGLNDDGHSTAADLGIITRYALKNSTFRQIITTQKYVATNTTKTIFHQLENSNRLVTTYQYPGAIGVKTGFTYAASHCLVGAATRGDHTLIAIVLGTYADTVTASADEVRKLLDWGFANVTWPN